LGMNEVYLFRRQIACRRSRVLKQCFSFTSNQYQPSSTSQPAVFFSHNKSASATSHSQPKVATIEHEAKQVLHQVARKNKIITLLKHA